MMMVMVHAVVSAIWLGMLGAIVTTSPARAETKHYGSRIAVVDTIAVGAFVGGAACARAVDADAIAALCGLAALGALITYEVGGPVAHSKHGKGTTASIDLVMRLVLPFGGIAAGAAIADCPDGELCTSSIIGAGVGIVAATSIDALLLARVEVATPYVAPASGGATIGVAGRF